MPTKGISVTLREENLLWLKSQTVASKARSLSATLDALVTEARLGGSLPASAVRSVRGTMDIAGDDPDLLDADTVIAGLVRASVSRPTLVRESRPPYAAGRRSRRRRG